MFVIAEQSPRLSGGLEARRFEPRVRLQESVGTSPTRAPLTHHPNAVTLPLRTL